ncbi:MAG TPA: transporter substrate-binding domain-containing protein [Bacilli bacterium]|nr:transporter substrate-binding domain-containing protein [Bacilli bacterium]
MKRRNKWLTFSLTALLTLSLVGCGNGADTDDQTNTGAGGDTAATKGKLIMATSADYPPYESHTTAGGTDEIVGFDVDIAKYITKQLGYDLEIQDMTFDGLIPALQAKRADFVMAGMTPKPERLKNADFSDIYYEAKNTIVTLKGKNLKTPDDLNGKTVGVQLGSIQESAAKDMAGVNIKPLNKINEIIQELKSKRIDAAIIEDTVIKGYAANNQDLEYNTIPNTEAAGSAVAFPKGSTHVQEFNTVLQQMQDNGKLDELIVKWFENK